MAEKSGKELSFEAALAQLEDIVKKLEGGTMGLDEMVSAFEKGQELIKLCNGKLNEVEKRIELLVKTPDGVKTEPMQ